MAFLLYSFQYSIPAVFDPLVAAKAATQASRAGLPLSRE
jgi:hypothetical protein